MGFIKLDMEAPEIHLCYRLKTVCLRSFKSRNAQAAAKFWRESQKHYGY